MCDNHINIQSDELGDDVGRAIAAFLRRAIRDYDGAPVGPTELAASHGA